MIDDALPHIDELSGAPGLSPDPWRGKTCSGAHAARIGDRFRLYVLRYHLITLYLPRYLVDYISIAVNTKKERWLFCWLYR